MTRFSDGDPDEAMIRDVQAHLQRLSEQLGQPRDAVEIAQLYQSAQELVGHLSPNPLTLARVAGVLLVYRLPNTDRDEATWFKTQLKDSQDNEAVEELIDSISRPDAL